MIKTASELDVIDESTFVEDMNKLIGQNEEKLKLHRFKCSYENCNRILRAYGSKPFRCTACGHGTMRLQKPRNYCCECGDSIYFSVSKDCDVVCDKCTDKKVVEIENLENEVGNELLKLRRLSQKKKKEEPLGIIRNKKDYELALKILKRKKEEAQEKSANEELIKAREKLGLSQKTLAIYLGCSNNYLCMMEKGCKPLNKKAIEFLKGGIKAKKKLKLVLSEE